jgi:hypothetical protein
MILPPKPYQMIHLFHKISHPKFRVQHGIADLLTITGIITIK